MTLGLLVAVGFAMGGIGGSEASAGPGKANAPPVAVDGVIDLRSWDFEGRGTVGLDGEWRFIPNALAGPGVTWPTGGREVAIRVPGGWPGAADGAVAARGAGTYRLSVLLPDPRPPLALRTEKIQSAWRLSINESQVDALGTVGLRAEDTVERQYPRITRPPQDADSWDLRLEVANFDHRKGGIRGSVRLGPEAAVRRDQAVQSMLDVFAVALMFGMGLYHLYLWSLRSQSSVYLAFGLFSLAMAGWVSTTSEIVLASVAWPEIAYALQARLEYLAIVGGPPLLIWILRELYPEEVPRWWVTALIIISAPLLLAVLILPPHLFTHTALVSRLVIPIESIAFVIGLGRAALARRDGVGLMFIGCAAVIAGALHDVLVESGLIALEPRWMGLGVLGLLLCQGLALAGAFSRALSAAEDLTERLAVAHNYNESVLGSLSSGVITLDRDGSVVKINRAAGRILGSAEEALLGKPAEELLQGEGNAWLHSLVSQVEEGGTAASRDDATITRADGAELSVNLGIAPLADSRSQSLGAVIVIDDISEERRLKGTMARYMSREVADRIISGGEEALSGQLGHATVLFSDIRQFTTLSEAIGPQGTVSMLNEYFSLMVDEVFAHDGILDKYIGDAIMAVFGTLSSADDHAPKALQCAIAMLKRTGELNSRRNARGEASLRIGIGLNSDAVIHGNIGSPKRMEYTCIGDGVNLASRLESANATFGTQLLISGFTWNRLIATWQGQLPLARILDKLSVKGKTEAVVVYEILEHRREREGEVLEQVIPLFEGGIASLLGRRWDEAAAAFRNVLTLLPDDGPSRIQLARAEHFAVDPPPPDWDGVWRMKTK